MTVARPPRRSISIFWLLLVTMILLVVIPLGIYSWRSMAAFENTINDNLRTRGVNMGRPAVKAVSWELRAKLDRLSSLAKVFEGYEEKAPGDGFKALLDANLLEHYVSPQEPFLVFLGPDQTSMAAMDGMDESQKSMFLQLAQQKALEAIQRDRPVELSPRSMTLQFLQGGSIVKREEVVNAWAIPMHVEGRPRAALVGFSSLSGLSKALQDFVVQEQVGFTLFLLDNQNRLVAHSQSSYEGKVVDFSGNPLVREILTVDRPKSYINRRITIREGGKDTVLLVTVAPVPGRDWYLIISVNQDEYFGPLHQIQRQAIFLLSASVIVSILLAMVLARVVSKPISDLANVARRMSAGELGLSAPEDAHTEVRDLQRAFNLLLASLREKIDGLDQALTENKRLYRSTISTIANAIDAKDPYTRGHSERVSRYSMIIGKEYGLPPDLMEILEFSSILHDVGKIGIEDKILRKPGALTDDEFKVMRTHPSKGEEILGSIPQMNMVVTGVKYHHERWSGGGYPDGLKGEDIPILARIVSVADTFDAMTTNRPYQRAMTFDVAANRINELCPKVYDPKAVAAFNRAFEKELFVQGNTSTQGLRSA